MYVESKSYGWWKDRRNGVYVHRLYRRISFSFCKNNCYFCTKKKKKIKEDGYGGVTTATVTGCTRFTLTKIFENERNRKNICKIRYDLRLCLDTCTSMNFCIDFKQQWKICYTRDAWPRTTGRKSRTNFSSFVPLPHHDFYNLQIRIVVCISAW